MCFSLFLFFFCSLSLFIYLSFFFSLSLFSLCLNLFFFLSFSFSLFISLFFFLFFSLFLFLSFSFSLSLSFSLFHFLSFSFCPFSSLFLFLSFSLVFFSLSLSLSLSLPPPIYLSIIAHDSSEYRCRKRWEPPIKSTKPHFLSLSLPTRELLLFWVPTGMLIIVFLLFPQGRCFLLFNVCSLFPTGKVLVILYFEVATGEVISFLELPTGKMLVIFHCLIPTGEMLIILLYLSFPQESPLGIC